MSRTNKSIVYNFASLVAETKPGLDEAQLEEILRKSLEGMGVDPGVIKGAATAAVKTVKRRTGGTPLRVRQAKKLGLYPCRLDPAEFGIHASSIRAQMLSMGVATLGCGRTFGSEARRLMHEAGDVKTAGDKGWWRPAFPYRCLSEIIPADKRDNR